MNFAQPHQVVDVVVFVCACFLVGTRLIFWIEKTKRKQTQSGFERSIIDAYTDLSNFQRAVGGLHVSCFQRRKRNCFLLMFIPMICTASREMDPVSAVSFSRNFCCGFCGWVCECCFCCCRTYCCQSPCVHIIIVTPREEYELEREDDSQRKRQGKHRR